MPKLFIRLCAWFKAHQAEVWTVAALLFVDRLTKCLTLAFLPERELVIAPFLHLRYVQNTGAAFGIMQGGNLFLIVLTLGIVGYLIKSWREFCAYGPAVKWGLVLILGGALGNLYDRIALGFVVDFVDLRVWPVFNAADSFITAGGVLLAWALLFSSPKNNREEK